MSFRNQLKLTVCTDVVHSGFVQCSEDESTFFPFLVRWKVERKILSLGSQAKTGQLTLESARLKSDELASAQHWTA